MLIEVRGRVSARKGTPSYAFCFIIPNDLRQFFYKTCGKFNYIKHSKVVFINRLRMNVVKCSYC